MTRRTRLAFNLATEAFGLSIATPVSAASPLAPDIIGFESDTGGDPKLNSKDDPTVHFAVIDRIAFSIQNTAGATHGSGLGVGGSGASKLSIPSDVPGPPPNPGCRTFRGGAGG